MTVHRHEYESAQSQIHEPSRPRRPRTRPRSAHEQLDKLADVIRRLQDRSGRDLSGLANELAASIRGQSAAPLAWGLADVVGGEIVGLLLAHPSGLINEMITDEMITKSSPTVQPNYQPWCWPHAAGIRSEEFDNSVWTAQGLPIAKIRRVQLGQGPRNSVVVHDESGEELVCADVTRARAFAVGWRSGDHTLFEAVAVIRHRSTGPRVGLELVGRVQRHPLRTIK